MSLAWIVNPRRKRRKAKARRRSGRSAAQRAATARMLAANRAKRGGGKRSRRVRRNPAILANPRRRSYRRNPSRGMARARRRFAMAGGAKGAMSMLKAASIAGAGAVAVDIAMGYAGRAIPQVATPMNTDGTVNWGYFAAKAGLAVGLGVYGKYVVPGGMTQKMGEGALTVLAYQIIRGFVPAGVALGGTGAYFNPAPTMRPRLAGSGRGGASFAGSGQGGASFGAYENGEGSAMRAASVVALARRRS